jgi:hypothetical protein
MDQTIIAQLIRKNNRVTTATGGILILAALVIATISERFLSNALRGPFPIDNAKLIAIADPAKLNRHFVTIVPDRAFETGYELTEKGKIVARYLILIVDRRALLTKVGADEPILASYSGCLTHYSEIERNKVMAELSVQNPRLLESSLPFVLDAHYRFKLFGWILTLILAAAGTIGVVMMALALSRSREIRRHPLAKTLAKYGDPDEIAAAIDREAAENGVDFGDAWVTNTWLVSTKCAIPLDEIVWVYIYIFNSHGAKSYFLNVRDRSGRYRQLKQSQKKVEGMLGEIVSRAPWVLAGYTKEFMKLWNRDKAKLYALVDERRRGFEEDRARAERGEGSAAPTTIGTDDLEILDDLE